jgi:hypothetical protein
VAVRAGGLSAAIVASTVTQVDVQTGRRHSKHATLPVLCYFVYRFTISYVPLRGFSSCPHARYGNTHRLDMSDLPARRHICVCPSCGEKSLQPKDLSIRSLLAQAFATFTNVDGKAIRSFRALVSNRDR